MKMYQSRVNEIDVTGGNLVPAINWLFNTREYSSISQREHILNEATLLFEKALEIKKRGNVETAFR